MHSIKITSGLSDLETIIGILVKNDYIVRTEKVMKEFPYENYVERINNEDLSKFK